MPLTADDVKIKRTYWGTGIADDIEQGVQNLMIGAATKVQEMAQDQEGIVDDALRLVGGGIKNVQAAAADQEGWGDDALRLMGGGVKNTLKVLGIAGEAGGWLGGKAAGALGVDPRIGGAAGNILGDVIGGGIAAKGLKIAKYTKALRALDPIERGAYATTAYGGGHVGAARLAKRSESLKIAATQVGKETLQEVKDVGKKIKSFYPELKPHRDYKTTSKLKTVEDYKQAWKDWPDKTEAGRNKFYKEKGHWITEENFKLKPSPVKQTPEEKAAGIKRFGEELSDRSDYGVWTRKQRGDILTYMSDEVPVSTKKASYKDPITGHNIIPHHRTSHGELAPWVDVIINKLNSPNPKIKAEGKQMMEIGKDVFKKAKIKVGDTYKNYEGYFHEAHLGPGSIHDRLTQHKITGPSSRSAFDFTKGKNPLSKGIMHKGKRIPTKDYIRMLPWKPAGNIGEFGDNTFWTTLVDYIQFSNMPRQTARKGVLSKFGRQGKNWAKGARQKPLQPPSNHNYVHSIMTHEIDPLERHIPCI